jgi:hypothetical protein
MFPLTINYGINIPCLDKSAGDYIDELNKLGGELNKWLDGFFQPVEKRGYL